MIVAVVLAYVGHCSHKILECLAAKHFGGEVDYGPGRAAFGETAVGSDVDVRPEGLPDVEQQTEYQEPLEEREKGSRNAVDDRKMKGMRYRFYKSRYQTRGYKAYDKEEYACEYATDV